MAISKSVLLIISTAQLGGAGKMIKYVANVLSSARYHVTLIVFYKEENPRDLRDEINVINLGLEPKGILKWRYVAMKSIRTWVKKNKPDVVCAFISDVCVMSRLATLGQKINFVSSERGDPSVNTFPWTVMVKWAYHFSDYCIFQLPNARDFFGGQMKEKSFVIPNFLKNNGLEPYHGDRNKTLVAVGRFSPEKRYGMLIEAFSIINKQHPEYKLIMYGEGVCKAEYDEIIKKYDISDKVVFPGYVSNIAERIHKEGIFVLTSHDEGMPNALMEALSVGIPCVSTNCALGGPAYMTDNGENALLVPVDNLEELTKAILKIIETPSLAKELSYKGPLIMKKLAESIVREQWLDAFKVITD